METLKKISKVSLIVAVPCWAVVIAVGLFFRAYINTPWNGACAIVGAITALIGAGIQLILCLCWFWAGIILFMSEVRWLYLYYRHWSSHTEAECRRLNEEMEREWQQVEYLSDAMAAI